MAVGRQLDSGHDRIVASVVRHAEGRHPVTGFLVTAILGFLGLVALMVGLGIVLTEGLLAIDSLAAADEDINGWLEGQRTAALDDASVIGSIISGGVGIPAVVAITCLVLALARRWSLAALVLGAIVIEVVAYRVVTLAVPRERPDVVRMEDLPVDASYPSGHMAAAVAVYLGVAMLIASALRDPRWRLPVWTVAGALLLFVAFSRMYRGMHHVTDITAGVIMGLLALGVALVASRVAGMLAKRRAAAGATHTAAQGRVAA